VVSLATIIQAEGSRERIAPSESFDFGSEINRVSDINFDARCPMHRDGAIEIRRSTFVDQLRLTLSRKERKTRVSRMKSVRRDRGGFSPRRRACKETGTRSLVTYVSRFLSQGSRNHISASCIAQTAWRLAWLHIGNSFLPLFSRRMLHRSRGNVSRTRYLPLSE